LNTFISFVATTETTLGENPAAVSVKQNTDLFFLSYAAGNILTAELKVFEQNQLAKLGN